MEELEAKITKLQEDLKKAQEMKGKAPVFVTRERKMDKFKGDEKDKVEEWTANILSYVNGRFQSTIEKSEFIFEHLEGNAKAEVKFRVVPSKSTPEEIIQILRDVFEDKDSVTQLQQKFFSANQEKGESVREYSYKLMDILGAILNKHASLYQDKDEVLKQKFADGIQNNNLRRELR